MANDDAANGNGGRPGGSGADSPSDHRVGDILRGQVSKEELDPATIAELAAWFGAPAQSILDAEQAGRGAPPAPPPPSRQTSTMPSDPEERLAVLAQYEHDPELRELWERRLRAMDAIDPGFLAHLESRAEEADGYINLPEPMSLPIEEPLEKLDMDAWRFNFLDLREREIDEHIYDALHQRAPQAVLRDLHRPVPNFPFILRPMDLGVDIAGQGTSKRIAEIMGARYNKPMRQIELASHAGHQGFVEMRSRLAEPWEDSYIPESERRGSSSGMPTAEDMKWFGAIGYDPFL